MKPGVAWVTSTPAALAAAQQHGASGRDLVRGIAIGLEVCVRLGMAGFDPETKNSVFFENGQHATSICGAMGGAAAAAVIGPADLHPGSHRILGGVSRAGTQHHELCVGGIDGMYTDTKGLLDGGLELVVTAWHEAQSDGWKWDAMDRYVTHQVSNSYTNAIIKAVDLERDRVPITFPHWGNVGPASLPMTLAQEGASLKTGDRVLCLGVGSGLNTSMMEIAW